MPEPSFEVDPGFFASDLEVTSVVCRPSEPSERWLLDVLYGSVFELDGVVVFCSKLSEFSGALLLEFEV